MTFTSNGTLLPLPNPVHLVESAHSRTHTHICTHTLKQTQQLKESPAVNIIYHVLLTGGLNRHKGFALFGSDLHT